MVLAEPPVRGGAAPRSSYLPPNRGNTNGFAPPSSSYGVPQDTYQAANPSDSYGPPANNGHSANNFHAASSAPSSNYGAPPQDSYGPPRNGFGGGQSGQNGYSNGGYEVS